MSPKSGKTNRRALVSFVLSLTSAVLFIGTWVSDGNLNVSAPLAILLSLAGAVVGRKAMRQIKETGEPGRGIALVGVIISWVLTAVVALFIVFFLAVAASWLLTPGW
jgi:phosphate/sulfate permease